MHATQLDITMFVINACYIMVTTMYYLLATLEKMYILTTNLGKISIRYMLIV